MPHVFKRRNPAPESPSGEREASGRRPVRDPAMDAHDTLGNAAVGDLVQRGGEDEQEGLLSAFARDRLTRLNDRELRPGDAVDRWSGVRERDRADWLSDTQVDPALLPEDPESVLAAKEPDWGLFVQACSNVPQARRQQALQVVRGQDRWDDMLAHLGPEHMDDVQSWLAEDLGDATEQSTEDRVAQSVNSSRGQQALSVVDGFRGQDPEGRLTDRLRELLALGVAMPANERDPLGSEGILSVASVTRACEALLAMPLQEYLRVSLLLELTGDASRLRQSFLLLEATAARLSEVSGQGDLEVLEGFSDDLRGMNDAQVVDATSVTQIDRRDRTAMVHKFTGAQGVAAAQTVRAEADPVVALRMNQSAELGRDALDSKAAAEQEAAIERSGEREAVARRSGDVRKAVLDILRMTSCTPAERANVQAYLTGLPYDEALYTSALPKIRGSMGLSFPGEQAMRLARESAFAGPQAGLSADELARESGELGVGDATGRDVQANTDQALVEQFVEAERELSKENLEAWRPHVERLLAQAGPRVDQGHDVMFEVKLEGGGSAFMTFTNVDLDDNRFLVFNTSNGKSSWIEQDAILRGDFSEVGVSRGLLTSLIH